MTLEPPPTALDPAVRHELLRASGWQFLLPSLRPDQVACYDCLGGATTLLLAGLARELRVIHHDEDELRRVEAKVGQTGQRGLRFERWMKGAGPPGTFDAVVVHDPGAAVLRRRGGGPELHDLAAWAAGLLRPDGVLYLGFRNRFSYTRLRGGPGGEAGAIPWARLLSTGVVHEALKKRFSHGRSHPLLLEGTRISEVVPASGYRSVMNPFLAAERLRRVTLGPWGSRRLAPGYGFVAFRGEARPGFVDRLLADEWVRAICPEARLQRYLVLGQGKVILSIAPAGTAEGTVILVLAPDPRAAARRRTEADRLIRLASLSAEIARAIPAFLGEQTLEGTAVFALKALPGMTVDRAASFLPELTDAAAAWLSRFHLATRGEVTVDETVYGRLFGPLFLGARARYPQAIGDLAELEARLRRAVMGRRIPTVWMHGDFKLENILFDPSNRRLQGVIDWELSTEQGLPLLDLLYLLTYDRVIRSPREEVLAAIADALLHDAWTGVERARLDSYLHLFGVDTPARRVLEAAFVLHHVGLRVRYDLDVSGTAATVRLLLRALGDRLADAR